MSQEKQDICSGSEVKNVGEGSRQAEHSFVGKLTDVQAQARLTRYFVYGLAEPEGSMCDTPLDYWVETVEESWERYHVGGRIREMNKPCERVSTIRSSVPHFSITLAASETRTKTVHVYRVARMHTRHRMPPVRICRCVDHKQSREEQGCSNRIFEVKGRICIHRVPQNPAQSFPRCACRICIR